MFHGFISIFSFPGRTKFVMSDPSSVVSNDWHIGHWRSMYSRSVTGALGWPSTNLFCGIPFNSVATAGAPGYAKPPVELPVAGMPLARLIFAVSPRSFELPLPLLSTMARTITPPAMARVRGDACRAPSPGPPLERTGGGAAACRRCCFALFPLGIGGKRSHVVAGPCARKDQESDEKKEGGEGERLDLEVSEVLANEPVQHTAARRRDETARRLGDRLVADEHVVDRDAGAHDRQREQVPRRSVVSPDRHEQEDDRERVHADPLEPAELARDEARNLRVEKAAACGDRGDDERRPELVAP